MLGIPVKTPEGQAELATRARQISQRHRTVLLLVDGRRSAEQVRSMATQAGAPEQCFDELLAMGLIALHSPPMMAEPPAAGPGPEALPQGPTAAPAPLAAAAPAPAPAPAPLPPAPVGSRSAGPMAAPVASAPAPSAPQRAPLAPAESVASAYERTQVLPGPSLRPTPLGRNPGADDEVPDSVLAARPDRSLFGEVEAEPFDSTNSMFVDAGEAYDNSLEEARAVLIRAVRAESPVAGQLTLMRLKRARTAGELADMLDEVESRISRPSRTLAAQQTLRRVRQLLLMAGHQSSSLL